MSRSMLWLAVLHCSTMAFGCGSSTLAVCTRDEECDSGFCRADGTCGAAEVDAGATSDGDGGPDAPPSGTCAPDHDGKVQLDELPHEPGRAATFRMTTDAVFDTTGVSAGDGSRRWNLAGALANDADRSIMLMAPAGTWWAPAFPAATYAAPLSIESDLLGVFGVDASGVSLLGVVSPEAGSSRTELAYDPPAKILALPVMAGATWTTTSTVSGLALGVFGVYTERYTSLVDQVGAMTTPYGEFPVVRVATDLRRSSGGVTLLTKRTFAWVAECFGPVATVSSQDNEAAAEFADPAEVRRLAP